MHKGTAPPAGIAQKPAVRKWYAYLEDINEIMPITVHTKPGEYPAGFYTGQPVVVNMPQTGMVAMVLRTPKNWYAWEVRDSSGKLH